MWWPCRNPPPESARHTRGSIVINKMVAFFTFCVGVQIVVTGIAKLFNLHV